MTIPFFILDVFAETKYAGNQLAVVLGGDKLSSEEMLRIAREMHFSETTFVMSRQERNGGFDVRIFTPAAEVPFAGHPTLGTAYLIRQEIVGKPVGSLALNLAAGQISVSFQDDIVWMKQQPPVFRNTFGASKLARVLNIAENEFDVRFPIEEVSTGLGFLIVPLRNLAAVKHCKIDLGALEQLASAMEAQGILVFAPETYQKENQLNVRVFVDLLGVPEDPATGSGNGCLAGYLVEHKYFGNDQIDIRIEQGMEIQRPSLVYLKAKRNAALIDVSVGGKVVLVANGDLV